MFTQPRILHLPGKGDRELGKRAVELSSEAGLELDEWQAYVLENSLSRTDEKWDYREVGLCVARQNGKNAILEARELAELYLVAEKQHLVIHSAHEFASSMEHFYRMRTLIEETPTLRKELTRGGIRTSNGSEGFTLKGNRRLRFKTRTKRGGRGFACDLLVLDEAMEIPESSVSALFPTKRARPNPQVWYTGSAVDQEIHEYGVVFSAVRKRGLEGAPKLAYFEWSVEGENPGDVLPEVLQDRAAWAQANPALGIRIDPDAMQDEYEELRHLPRTFAVELLGIGDWPRVDFRATNPLDFDGWMALANPGGVIAEPQFVAFDVSPERKAAVVIAGRTKQGDVQGELIESRGGTLWVVAEVARLAKTYKLKVRCDGRGPASSLVPELRDEGVDVEQLTASEHAQACGQLMDGLERGVVRHLDDPELNAAVRAARVRPLGDAWAWSRKDSSTNIAPLVAFTIAVSAAMTQEKPRKQAFAWA